MQTAQFIAKPLTLQNRAFNARHSPWLWSVPDGRTGSSWRGPEQLLLLWGSQPGMEGPAPRERSARRSPVAVWSRWPQLKATDNYYATTTIFDVSPDLAKWRNRVNLTFAESHLKAVQTIYGAHVSLYLPSALTPEIHYQRSSRSYTCANEFCEHNRTTIISIYSENLIVGW